MSSWRKGNPVMEVEDGPLETLDEGVEVRAAGRDPVMPQAGLTAGLAERSPELRTVVGRRGHEPETGPAAGRGDVLGEEAGHDRIGMTIATSGEMRGLTPSAAA